MSLFDWCRDTLTVERAPLVEERGNPVYEWGTAVTHDIPGCSLQPGGMALTTDGLRVANREIRYEAWLPPDADIQPTDRVIIHGRPYLIADGVQEWRGVDGMIDHLHIQLADWRG